MIDDLKFKLTSAQNRMKYYCDRHRAYRVFSEGYHVWLKLQPYKQQFVQSRKNNKRSSKYFGPLQITNKIGKLTYKLKLPESA